MSLPFSILRRKVGELSLRAEGSERPILLGILLLAFALRLYRLADSNVWWDEGWSIWLARRSLGEIALITAADEHPPLHYFLLHFWDRWVGQEAYLVRFSSLALALLTVALLYRLGRAVTDGKVGLLAALLLAISRFHIWWSQEIKMYSLAALLSLLSLYLFLRLRRGAGWALWASFVLVNALALYTHYLTLLILLAENLTFLLLSLRKDNFKALFWPWFSAQGATFALFAPWLYLALTHPASWRSPPPFHFPLFLRLSATVLSLGVTVDIEPLFWPAMAFLLLALLGLIPLFRGEERARQGSLLLLMAVGLPPLIIYLLSLPPATSFYAAKVEARYLLIFLPPFLLLLAQGLRWLGRRLWPLGLATLLFVLASLGYTLKDYYADRWLRDDYATLAGYVRSYWREGDGVVLDTDFAWPVFLYYAGERPWYGIPYAQEVTPQWAEGYLSPLMTRHEAIWLVLSPDSLVRDPQGLVPSFLASRLPEVVNRAYGDKRLILYSSAPRDLCVVPPGNLNIEHPLGLELSPGLRLVGYDLPVREVRTGDILRVVTYWQGEGDVKLALLGPQGQAFQEVPLSLAGCPEKEGTIRQEADIYITSQVASGRYTLSLSLEEEKWSLGEIRVAHITPKEKAPPSHPREYKLGDEVRFLGFDLERDTYSTGEAIHLVLHWEALSPMDTSYVVFTHLLGQEYNPQRGNFIWGQVDSIPLGGSYPTTGWAPGERIADEYWIPIDPQAPQGDYELEVGMYEPATGVRLPVFDAQGVALGDRILLAHLKVGVWP